MDKVGTLGPRHDVPHLHGAGQPRLRRRSRHGQEAARLAGAAADRHRAVRQLAVHRRQAHRLPVSFRSHIWLDTDHDRTGMLPFAFEDGFGFERYADYALDVPMYFVMRDERVHRRRRRELPRLPRRQAAAAAGREADDQGLGRPPLDPLPRGAAEAVPRDARRRHGRPRPRPARSPPSGSACSTTEAARRRLGPRQGLDRRGARRRSATTCRAPR